jgi:hypothetical protein
VIRSNILHTHNTFPEYERVQSIGKKRNARVHGCYELDDVLELIDLKQFGNANLNGVRVESVQSVLRWMAQHIASKCNQKVNFGDRPAPSSSVGAGRGESAPPASAKHGGASAATSSATASTVVSPRRSNIVGDGVDGRFATPRRWRCGRRRQSRRRFVRRRCGRYGAANVSKRLSVGVFHCFIVSKNTVSFNALGGTHTSQSDRIHR